MLLPCCEGGVLKQWLKTVWPDLTVECHGCGTFSNRSICFICLMSDWDGEKDKTHYGILFMPKLERLLLQLLWSHFSPTSPSPVALWYWYSKRGFIDISGTVKKATLEICVCIYVMWQRMVQHNKKLIVSNVISLSPPPQAGSTASCVCVCVWEKMRQKSKRLFE